MGRVATKCVFGINDVISEMTCQSFANNLRFPTILTGRGGNETKKWALNVRQIVFDLRLANSKVNHDAQHVLDRLKRVFFEL